MTDYKTETTLIDSLSKEWEAVVYFDYQPSEKQTLNYHGCDAEITINKIEIDGDGNDVDIDSLSSDCIDKIMQDCWDFMENLLKE